MGFAESLFSGRQHCGSDFLRELGDSAITEFQTGDERAWTATICKNEYDSSVAMQRPAVFAQSGARQYTKG